MVETMQATSWRRDTPSAAFSDSQIASMRTPWTAAGKADGAHHAISQLRLHGAYIVIMAPIIAPTENTTK